MGGYRSILHTLQLEGIQVPRDVVEGIVRELDPEGCEERKAKRLKRRRFVSPDLTIRGMLMAMTN
jgi:hypothetical protein